MPAKMRRTYGVRFQKGIQGILPASQPAPDRDRAQGQLHRRPGPGGPKRTGRRLSAGHRDTVHTGLHPEDELQDGPSDRRVLRVCGAAFGGLLVAGGGGRRGLREQGRVPVDLRDPAAGLCAAGRLRLGGGDRREKEEAGLLRGGVFDGGGGFVRSVHAPGPLRQRAGDRGRDG